MHLRFALMNLAVCAVVAATLAPERSADADGAASVFVYSPAPSPVRVRVISDCAPGYDSTTLYEGLIDGGQTLRVPIGTFCVCASSTSVEDPQGDYSPWARYCGPTPRRGRPIVVTNFGIHLDGH